MTRLSEALKRAAETPSTAPVTTDAVAPPADNSTWQFAPVETMHVPEEPGVATEAQRRRQSAGAVSLAPVDLGHEPVAAAPAFVPEERRRVGRASTLNSAAPSTREPVPAVAPVSAAVTAFLPLAQRFGEDRHKLIVGEGVDAALVEQYRHLAAMMHHAQKASNVRSVMVTSALPSEGKTLTATNLALTLSESYQKRVLLIDADLRRPRMQEMFALPSAEGLTDSLALRREGKLPVQQVTPTLWVLTAGSILPDPMSLLVSPAMKQLLEDAMDAFDWVVVDTPPIAILSDANLLASMIDTTLLVVSAQSTPYPMVQRAAQAVGTNRILGVVLNRAEKAGLPANYGYYGANHYQQGPPKPTRRGWFGWLRRRGNAPHVQ
jgi:protein-tyrosine kinase